MANEVVVEENNGRSVEYVSRETSDRGLPVISIMPGQNFSAKQLFNMQDDEVALDDYLEAHDRKIENIVGFYARYSDNLGKNDDGTFSKGYQVVLITAGGEAIRVSSQIAVKRIQTLLTFFGAPAQWTQSVGLQFKSIKVPRGKSWSIRLL